jgi:NAD+ kinase
VVDSPSVDSAAVGDSCAVQVASVHPATLTAVGVVLHPRRDSVEAVEVIAAWAESRGMRLLGLAEELDRLRARAECVEPHRLAGAVDLLVSLGGDGTMLRALRMVHGHAVPVLGVNLGKLGFLAEVDVPELPAALEAIGRGEHQVEARVSVTARVRDRSATAFNDVVLARRPGQGMAGVALWVEGKPFVRYSADAIIVSTPTGSTAYNFSAGGPIVWPDLDALLLVPISAHALFARPLVVSPHSLLELELQPNGDDPASKGAVMWCDGRRVLDLPHGAHVKVRRGALPVRFARLHHAPFTDRLVAKFALPVDGWRAEK